MAQEKDNIRAGQRSIKPGSAYNHFFPAPRKQDKVVMKNGEVMDTLDILKEVVLKSLHQTEKIANNLKKSDVYSTCSSIWSFLHDHIQYKLDAIGVEQLREPARSWADRTSGIDCDCFSVFISSILSNLGISHKFRITKYNGKSQFQHIYVVVPSIGKEIIIDCVLSKFDYEKPYSEKKDIIMSVSKGLNGIDIAVLSGVEQPPTFQEDYINVVSGAHFSGTLDEDTAIVEHLRATRRVIAQRPDLVRGYDDPNALLSMLDYAILNWNTPNREKAMGILAANEEVLNGILEGRASKKAARQQKKAAKKTARMVKKEVRKETRAAKKEVRKETRVAKKEVKKLQKTLKKAATTRAEKKAVRTQVKTAKKTIKAAGKKAVKQVRATGKSNIKVVRAAVRSSKPIAKIKRAPISAAKTTLRKTIRPIIAKKKAMVATAEAKIKQNMLKMGTKPEEIKEDLFLEPEEIVDTNTPIIDDQSPEENYTEDYSEEVPQEEFFEEESANDVPEEEDYEFLNEEEPEGEFSEEEDLEEEYPEEGEYDEQDEEYDEDESGYDEEESYDEQGVGRVDRKKKRAEKKTARKKKKADKKVLKKEVKAQNKENRKAERARIKALPKKERTKARLKNIGKALVRFNPLTGAARGAFMMALKLNIGKMASKVKWGYGTEAQAAAKGVSKLDWQIQKKNLEAMEKIFEKMGGIKTNLKAPILFGKAGNLAGIVLYTEEDLREDLQGLGYIGLGDPITAGAVIAGVAAAVPMIVEVVKAFKKNKSLTPEEEAAAMDEIQGSQASLTAATEQAYDQAGIDGNSINGGGFSPKKLIVPGLILAAGIGFLVLTNKKKKTKK